MRRLHSPPAAHLGGRLLQTGSDPGHTPARPDQTRHLCLDSHNQPTMKKPQTNLCNKYRIELKELRLVIHTRFRIFCARKYIFFHFYLAIQIFKAQSRVRSWYNTCRAGRCSRDRSDWFLSVLRGPAAGFILLPDQATEQTSSSGPMPWSRQHALPYIYSLPSLFLARVAAGLILVRTGPAGRLG